MNQRRGRRPLDPSVVRSKRASAYLTPTEKATLAKLADRKSISESDYLLELLYADPAFNYEMEAMDK